MKKFFRYLAAALLVGTSLAAVSCSDDPEEPIIPQFPTPLPQQTVLPGESCNITIMPNMTWEVAIPEEARSWFYLDDNGTKVSKVHGEAVLEGGQPITIKVGAEDVEIFDAVDPVEVTMTMGTESKTIATLTIQHQDRELKFRMAKIEDGEYAYNDDTTSPLQYSYEADANTTGSVKLEVHGGAFYGARLLVESNVSWTISVPDWIIVRVNAEAATSGAAGQSEVELRADDTKMPLEGAKDVACLFNATAADGSAIELARIAVSLDNLTGLLECDRLPEKARFSARGNYLASASTIGASLNGSITAPEGVKIIALSKGPNGGFEEPSWVKTEIDPWSTGEGLIQTRDVSISVDPQAVNNGTVERQADIFVLPATVNITAAELVTEDWSAVREEYQQYLVTTITQEAPMFVFNPQNSLAMEENGVKLELAPTDESGESKMFDEGLMYCDWLHNDNNLYYKLTYSNEWSSDGGAIDVIPATWCPAYTSYKIYGYYTGAPGDNFPADNQWIQLNEIRNPESNAVESFTVQMNFDKEYIDAHSKKYAIIVFLDDTDTAIATLECTFDDGTGSGGGAAGAVNFAYPQYATTEGSSIEMLSAGDADYDKYAGAYADFSPSVYRVTFTSLAPTISMIKGLPYDGENPWCEVIDGVDWLSRPEPASEVTFAGCMNTQKSAKGAYIFYTGGSGFDEATQKVIDPQGPAVILVIDLVLEQR